MTKRLMLRACKKIRDQLDKSFLSYHVGPRNRSQVIRFGSKEPYLLVHLDDPKKDLKKKKATGVKDVTCKTLKG